MQLDDEPNLSFVPDFLKISEFLGVNIVPTSRDEISDGILFLFLLDILFLRPKL